MITLTLTEQQVQILLAALAETPIKIGLDTFNTVQMQIIQQRQPKPPSEPPPE